MFKIKTPEEKGIAEKNAHNKELHKKRLLRYCGYWIDRRLIEENVCRVGVHYTYLHRGNDFDGPKMYDEREEKVKFLSIVSRPGDMDYDEEIRKIQVRLDKINYEVACLETSSSRWYPNPKINSTLKYSKPYDNI